MNTILLSLVVMVCGVDNYRIVPQIWVVQIINKENMLGRAPIGMSVKLIWFQTDTTRCVDEEDFEPDFPYFIWEGTKQYDTVVGGTKTVNVYRRPTITEEMEIRKMLEERKKEQPKSKKKKSRKPTKKWGQPLKVD